LKSVEGFVIQVRIQFISEGLTIRLGFVTDTMYFPVTEFYILVVFNI